MPSFERVAEAIGAAWRFLIGETDATRDALTHVFEDNFDGTLLIGEDGIILAASRVASALLLGPNGGSVVGRAASDVLPGSMLAAVQQAFADGRVAVPSPMAPALVGDPEGGRILVYVVNLSEVDQQSGLSRRVVQLTFWDDSERRQRDEELIYVGTHDHLTGALTRAELIRTINEALDSERRRAAGLFVLALDLNRLNLVNNGLGRKAGDMLLRQLVGRIKAAGMETVARLGGDIFAMIHPGRPPAEEMQAICDALLERVTEPYMLGPHRAIVGASIGLTHTDTSGFDAETLLSHADVALAEARATSGSRSACFTPDMDRRLTEHQAMDLALRLAMDRDELSLVYEPQCTLEGGELVGVEAVPRWMHPDLGLVPPDRFIPAAEENGEIIAIGRWMMRTACREAAAWPGQLRLAVRISPVQFEFADVVEDVRQALEGSGLASHRLDLEIDERIALSGAGHVAEALHELRRIGVGLVLEDLAKAEAPLRAPGMHLVDKIRIDRSIVARLPADADTAVIIRTVTALAETHGKLVIACGIENADQAWMLRITGCRVGQGRHFGRPRSGTEMTRWLSDGVAGRALPD